MKGLRRPTPNTEFLFVYPTTEKYQNILVHD